MKIKPEISNLKFQIEFIIQQHTAAEGEHPSLMNRNHYPNLSFNSPTGSGAIEYDRPSQTAFP